ncbi:hypothetical protein JXA32_04390 [Candidatus Sumerlaeota bacterium]|nr:hypothetical protein [Candidatus Sumerlaeota bacterium]
MQRIKPAEMIGSLRSLGIVSALFLILSCAPALASGYRFDFGDTMIAPDYFPVDAKTLFTAQRGYGWLEPSGLDVRDRTTPGDSRRDFIFGQGPATFRIAGLKPGKYLLTIVSGDMEYGDHVTRVRISGNTLELPLMNPARSEFATLTVTITAQDSVEMIFDSPEDNWVINSLTLEPTMEDREPNVTRQAVTFEDIQNAAEKTPSTVEASQPEYLPEIRFHLTSRPWTPVNEPKSAQFDRIERAIHALAECQHWNEANPSDAKNGAIIDPFDNVEIQYATPHFSFIVAVLLTEGRSIDLAEQGARALDRATLDISSGKCNGNHGEFFAAPIVKALRIYESLQAQYPQITGERIETWKKRLSANRNVFMNMNVRQNWRTFAMEGEWLREQDGYISDGVAWNEACWLQKAEGGQRERFLEDSQRYGLKPNFCLYHDHTADPETFAYNGATTANLLKMLGFGYNGPSADEMRAIIEHNLRSSLLLMSGSGEAPGGGRTGEHIWDDTIYSVGFERMAEIFAQKGNLRLAGQFRRATQLLLQSHARFQQERGWFSITKNQFHSSLKHRYASWSGLTNYGCFTLTCLTETLQGRKTEIPEQATPSEIGGYAVTLDPSFSNIFLNAGGMQAQICTRGETDAYGWVQWHTLGITRFSRMGFESRLGPGAGHVNPDFSDGVSFSPAFLENGKWTRVCLQPKRFQGKFHTEFVHPLLVRGTYTIAPLPGQTGPAFEMQLTLTPDGALVDTRCVSGDMMPEQFGVIWPLFEFDGRTVLNTQIAESIASTAYPRMNGAQSVQPASQAAKADEALEWTGVDGGEGGATTIGFHYALGVDRKAMRRMKLIVNQVPQPDLVFLSTGAWDDWHQLYAPVTLERGTKNTIRIEPAGDSGNQAVIDELRVYPAMPSEPEPDQQNFIALQLSHQLDANSPSVRGGYGDFRPVRVTDSNRGTVETFVYPRNAGDPDAESVRASFKRDGLNFSSVLGRVEGALYVGRTSAGGVGDSIDLDNDGQADVTFDQPCAFILQLNNGKVSAIETDQAVTADINGEKLRLDPFTPSPLE